MDYWGGGGGGGGAKGMYAPLSNYCGGWPPLFLCLWSDLGLPCLLRPICVSTDKLEGKYLNIDGSLGYLFVMILNLVIFSIKKAYYPESEKN